MDGCIFWHHSETIFLSHVNAHWKSLAAEDVFRLGIPTLRQLFAQPLQDLPSEFTNKVAEVLGMETVPGLSNTDPFSPSEPGCCQR